MKQTKHQTATFVDAAAEGCAEAAAKFPTDATLDDETRRIGEYVAKAMEAKLKATARKIRS